MMTKKTSLTKLLTLDFPAWVRELSVERRKLLAEVARVRLIRSNPVATDVARKMVDDVAIANLLFRIDDRAAIEMLMEGLEDDAIESR
jgi:hypothetical protein